MNPTIIQLYPNAKKNLVQTPANLDLYHFFELENESIAIPKADMAPNEVFLMEMMVQKGEFPQIKPARTNHWQNYLEKQTNHLPVVNGDIQLAYLDFKKTPQSFESKLWFETLKESIPAVIEWWQLPSNRYVVVLKLNKRNDFSIDEFSAIIQTLNIDFETDCRVIVGYMYTANRTLPQKYQEELKIANVNFSRGTVNGVQLLSPLLLKNLGHHLTEETPLLAQLKQTIASNSEYIQLIQMLFDSQGNLSQTADKLYIHRNTLTYRLQKFEKETGMHLQNLPDLIICYLCLPY